MTSCLIPRLLVVFTQQLEILVTTLFLSGNYNLPSWHFQTGSQDHALRLISLAHWATKLLSSLAQDQNFLAPCNRAWVFSCPVKENPAFIQHLLYLQEERRRSLHGYQLCHVHKWQGNFLRILFKQVAPLLPFKMKLYYSSGSATFEKLLIIQLCVL